MTYPLTLYTRVGKPHKREVLLTFFEKLYVEFDEITESVALQLFADLLVLRDQYASNGSHETTKAGTTDSGACLESITWEGPRTGDLSASGWNRTTLVELRGIEPLTSSMPWKRSAN